MNVKVLELNDSELRLLAGEELLTFESGFVRISPEQAVAKTPQLEFGDSARREIRRNPRQVNMHHWHRLNMDPLANPSAHFKHQADLVFRQLQHLSIAGEIGAEDQIVLAAPTCTSAEQLSLLLGIALEAGINICGIVDSQLAAAASPRITALPLRCQVIDLSLFSSTITTLSRAENLISEDCRVVPEMGLTPLLDGWVSAVADRLLNETRFDPLRIADTEQQVFDQVYEWLEAARKPRVLAIQVSYQGVDRQVEISPDQLTAKAAQRYALLKNSLEPDTPLLLSHRASRLPGFQATLEEAGHHLSFLQESDLARGILEHQKEILSDPQELKFVTQLVIQNRSVQTAPGTSATSESNKPTTRPGEATGDTFREPTHLVCDGHAVAIAGGLKVSSDEFPSPVRDKLNGLSKAGVQLQRAPQGVRVMPSAGEPQIGNIRVNGAPLQASTLLTTGDELIIGNQKFLLIRVEDGS